MSESSFRRSFVVDEDTFLRAHPPRHLGLGLPAGLGRFQVELVEMGQRRTVPMEGDDDEGFIELDSEEEETRAVAAEDDETRGYNRQLYNENASHKKGHQRAWHAAVSFFRISTARAGQGSSMIITSVIAGNVANKFVSDWLLVWTDHMLLLTILVLSAGLVIKFIRDQIFSYIVDAQLKKGVDPVIDRWNTNLLDMLDFLFRICLFSCIQLALFALPASGILSTGSGQAFSYIAALLFVVLHIYVLIGHGTIAALANSEVWLAQPVVTTSTEEKKK